MGTTRHTDSIGVQVDPESADRLRAGYRIRFLASRAGFARPDAEIGFIEFAAEAPRVAADSSVVDDVIVAYVTEMLTHKRKLSARWVKLRELLAMPVEELDLSKADLARLRKKHLARVGETLLADSPAPEPVVEEAREAANALLGELRRELEKILEQAADADTDQTWRPGDDLIAQRDATLNYGGKPPYEPRRVMQLLAVTTRQALAERRRKGQLLGLPVGERKILYPQWQFGDHGSLIPGLAEVLAVTPREDPWGVADILTSPQEIFDGQTPIDVLARGSKPQAVKKTVELVRRAYA